MLTLSRSKGIRHRELGVDKNLTNSKFLIPNPQTGFTLLEVLVAVAILGSALAVLLGAVNKNLILASQSKNLAVAGMLAQKKITEVELEGFPEIREEEGEFEEAPGFKWFLSVRPLDIPELGIQIRVVRLLITWNEGEKDFEVTLAMSDFK
jgi:general secretion pathway protein I